ncbi:Hypothetical_protein [Hexamita inflata]|uniref:Hypothetical_protein n=1 Tax=Hexamita inflata TaxID=28002 RepID=A0AA86NRI5_9EUKA|nr:Hypothetical protein HINF_LOCUS11574 [Hexamita inflata]CAI9956848.1 Hypothetical protein HINF_LOCUS44493 [Hexamita inflata]
MEQKQFLLKQHQQQLNAHQKRNDFFETHFDVNQYHKGDSELPKREQQFSSPPKEAPLTQQYELTKRGKRAVDHRDAFKIDPKQKNVVQVKLYEDPKVESTQKFDQVSYQSRSRYLSDISANPLKDSLYGGTYGGKFE